MRESGRRRALGLDQLSARHEPLIGRELVRGFLAGRSAGAQYGQELPPDAMEQVIRSHGRVPRQRTTLYGDVPAERRAASFAAEPLAEPWNPPVRDAGLKAPSRLVRPGFVRA